MNLLQTRRFAEMFSESIEGAARAASLPWSVVGPGEIPRPGEWDRFTHLLLSGSEASALLPQPWEQELRTLVAAWAASGKPGLGICYGHQFLAKVLLGPQSLRRSSTPEFGFVRTRFAPHPLFEGLGDAFFFNAHMEEVHRLPEHGRVLAATDRCPIQAVAYGPGPLVGVQFHPEFDRLQGEEILRSLGRSPRPTPAPEGGAGRVVLGRFLRLRPGPGRGQPEPPGVR
ncbi:MAG: hypothetical protein HY823_04800 [Acidobacteria bacterium]|nr:hypothetical protein [Acidobacteriota bacterium]